MMPESFTRTVSAAFFATNAGNEIAASTRAIESLRKLFAIFVTDLPQISASSPSIEQESTVGLADNLINFLTHSGQSNLPICTVK
ncbi:MAG: hypothetical protein WAT12_08950 [Candidatus Nitrotoga sp.]